MGCKFDFDVNLKPKEGPWFDLYYDIHNCTKCPLHKEASYMPTPFYGNTESKIMFVGRNPGIQERDNRIPFVGKTLFYMEELFKFLGFKDRSQIYITNLVKCYTCIPTRDRPPTEEEIKFCGEKFLNREIGLLRPKIIVALGNPSFNYLVGPGSVVPNNGNIFDLNIKGLEGSKVMAFYHPGYLMRNPHGLASEWTRAADQLKALLSSC